MTRLSPTSLALRNRAAAYLLVAIAALAAVNFLIPFVVGSFVVYSGGALTLTAAELTPQAIALGLLVGMPTVALFAGAVAQLLHWRLATLKDDDRSLQKYKFLANAGIMLIAADIGLMAIEGLSTRALKWTGDLPETAVDNAIGFENFMIFIAGCLLVEVARVLKRAQALKAENEQFV